MKLTTPICLVAKNVGKPDDSLTIGPIPMAECVKQLVVWLGKTTMAKSITIEIARNPSDLTSKSGRESQLETLVADIFDNLESEVEPAE